MNNYTREDILRMVEEEDVGFIRLQFTDIFGTMKNIAITTSQLDKALIMKLCLTVRLLKDLQEWKSRICICIRI